MKYFKSSCWLILMFSLSIIANNSISQNPPTTARVFDIHRGVNISHWLSQSKVRGTDRKAHFTKKDVMMAAKAGFDHIRIPIDEVQMWSEDGQKEVEAFELLHNALKWMEEYHLKAIVDLHIIRSHYFLDEDPPLFKEVEEQKKFANLWTQLSEELKNYPRENVAYELLNESVAKDHDDWNKVYKLAYDAVRKNEPNRIIFIGPNRWQNADYFPYLTIPKDDPNIVLSFHFYHPHIITHYKASWTNIKDYQGPVKYPGIPVAAKDTVGLPKNVRDQIRPYTREVIDKSYLENKIKPALDKARELNLQLYCGEFGCLNTVAASMRDQWYHDLISLLELHQIAWTAWDFKSGGFGVFNANDYSLTIPQDILFMGRK
ncbi:MAG: cellulase family glycosylhydrolase [Saprospiraceae bacterium]|nr:cellulase family glycosylhydrolase [Saprospiraceae bacterium]